MYSIILARSRVFFHIMVSTTLYLLSQASCAADIVVFDFEDAGGKFELTAEAIAPQLSASPWSDADGTLTSFSGNPGLALAARSWDDGNSLHFVLSTVPDQALHLDGFSFDQRASSSGATSWSLLVAGLEVATGSTAPNFTTESSAFSTGPLSGDIAIALFGSGASGSSGTWRIDNFTLSGGVTTVPLPGSLVLMLSTICGLVGMRWLAPV